jgi:hypothetical protein
MTTKICTKCEGEFTWVMPYTGAKNPCGSRPCTCAPKAAGKSSPAQREGLNAINSGNFVTNPVSEFTTLARTAYLQISVLAAELNAEGATVKDNHIFTCGLLHDYFQFRAGKGI